MRSYLFIFSLILAPIAIFSDAYVLGKIGYFRPTSDILRDIYGSAWVDFGIEASGSFIETNPALYLVGKVNYAQNDGRSIGLGNHTHMDIVPLSIGPRVLGSFDYVDLFIGAGPNYTFVHVHNDSLVAKSNVNEGGFGGYGELGLFLRHQEHFVIGLIASYSYSPISPPHSKACKKHHVDVGGLFVDLTFGYKF